MSVIAFDGKTVAADCQMNASDMRALTSKIMRLADGTILGWTGALELGLLMAQWYQDGAVIDAFPQSKDEEDFSRLLVFQPTGKIFYYERYGVAIPMLNYPAAWGCGRDFALGAMAMGADARKAVEIASEYSVFCGMGVEAFDLASVRVLEAV